MSHAGSCHMGDLDGDGDPDLIVMDWNMGSTNTVAHAIMYTNDGTGKFTLGRGPARRRLLHADRSLAGDDRRRRASRPAITPHEHAAPITYWGIRPIDVDFADVDNDFDIDILVNMRNGFSRIFFNDGHGNFKDGTNFGPGARRRTV